jgi:hypothetical protein
MEIPMTRSQFLATALGTPFLPLLSLAAVNQALADEALDRRVAALLPTPEEDRWLQIPWRTSIAEALADSRKTGKPVMLWVMNGNPLGCA